MKTLQMCFLMFSICFGVLSSAASPSSLYRPKSVLYSGGNFDSRYKPTNSHVSVSSKLPIVTSKSNFDVFLHHVVFWLNNTEVFAWMMMFFLVVGNGDIVCSESTQQKRTKNVKYKLTECQFKTGYNDHTSSFRNPKYKHATELSKYVWNLNDDNVRYSIKWKILARYNSYSNKTKRCHLCLHEKFIIIYHPHLASLNSRNELLSECTLCPRIICRSIFLQCNMPFVT